MRIIFTHCLLLSTFLLFAQEAKLKKNPRGQYEISEVVTLDSFPAAQLYFNSTLFLANAFQGVRETSQIKDKKAMSVATKGSFPVSIENSYGEIIKAKTYFTLVIQSQENMYKYTISDFYFGHTEETGITSYASYNDRRGIAMSLKQWQEIEVQSEAFLEAFIADLKEEMSQQEILCKEVLSARKKLARH